MQWDDFNDEELVHLVDPEVSTEYEVVVVDNCDYAEFASTQVDVQTVKATILRESLGDDSYAFDVLVDPAEPYEGAYFYQWDFGDGQYAYERAPIHVYDGLSTYQAQVDVTTDIGCTDVAIVDVYGDVSSHPHGVHAGQRWTQRRHGNLQDVRFDSSKLDYNRRVSWCTTTPTWTRRGLVTSMAALTSHPTACTIGSSRPQVSTRMPKNSAGSSTNALNTFP